MTALPLLVFDTNILMDVLLRRDGDQAVLLVDLAERRGAELVIPEYVLLEFRGTALRYLREEQERLSGIRRAANEWIRSEALDQAAQEMRAAASRIEEQLKNFAPAHR